MLAMLFITAFTLEISRQSSQFLIIQLTDCWKKEEDINVMMNTRKMKDLLHSPESDMSSAWLVAGMGGDWHGKMHINLVLCNDSCTVFLQTSWIRKPLRGGLVAGYGKGQRFRFLWIQSCIKTAGRFMSILTVNNDQRKSKPRTDGNLSSEATL